ncbi:hypothetical protein P0M11_02255 [Kaistella sp. PBT33-4]|uniref:hypothetical protein n=1 Tax=Kaistella sp. PBT33-4 TaxID=3032000 RepID=UPI0023D89163|nr:hypothetical protein [Kaistella sp. PBT33-4]MDF0718813.1 hypothetical protein [Kaistella sp. PBT33-4]
MTPMKMKYIPFIVASFHLNFDAQIITVVDPKTRLVQNYEEIKVLSGGRPVSSAAVDGKVIIEKDGRFYRIVNFSAVSPKDFGAKGDAMYRLEGDINALRSGTDDTEAIGRFLGTRNISAPTGSHLYGTALYFPYSVYRTSGAYIISDHYTKIYGDGPGISIIHANAGQNREEPLFFFGRKPTVNAWDSLLSGGGLSNLQINTDNSSIRSNAVVLDYVEYMSFQDLYFSGFGKSAIKGSFWEGYFRNIKFENCGTMQTSNNLGLPLSGVIDSESETSNPYSDASNNSLFEKLTFSSCAGTLLKLTAAKNTTVNMNFNGLYIESYYEDAGPVNDLPMIYTRNAKSVTINNGFITVNSTGIVRKGLAVYVDDNSSLSLSNFALTLNPVDGYTKRSVKRLDSFIRIDVGSVLSLHTVKFADPTDSVGFGLDSVPALIRGEGKLMMNLITFDILASHRGGTRRLTNLIDRRLQATGLVLVTPFDHKGEVPLLRTTLQYTEGKISVLADEIPASVETWDNGDHIKFITPKNETVGMVCTEPGTSGTLMNVVGSGRKNEKTLTVNSVAGLLVGDWIRVGDDSNYNRISGITGKKISLEQPLNFTVSEVKTSYKAPVWKNLTLQ